MRISDGSSDVCSSYLPFHQLAEDGDVADFLLPHRAHVTANELGEDHHVRLALMVEDEDAGARRPEMPLVLDLQLDAGDRGREIAEQAEREIDGLALRPGQRPDRQAGGERADERAGRIDGAGIVDPADRTGSV